MFTFDSAGRIESLDNPAICEADVQRLRKLCFHSDFKSSLWTAVENAGAPCIINSLVRDLNSHKCCVQSTN